MSGGGGINNGGVHQTALATTAAQLYHHHHRHCTYSSSMPMMAALSALSATRMLFIIFILIVCFGAMLAAFSLRAVVSKMSQSRMQQQSINSLATTGSQREEGNNKEWNDLVLFSLSAGDLELENKQTAQVINALSVRNQTLQSKGSPVAQSSASHHQHQHHWPISASFDWEKSTEENYALVAQIQGVGRRRRRQENSNAASIDPAVFSASKYASIRETLDYKYHRVYSTARQLFQDSIIDDMLRTHCTAGTFTSSIAAANSTSGGLHLQQPWIIFTAGVMGAGKVRIEET
jgi:hypothetical protein